MMLYRGIKQHIKPYSQEKIHETKHLIEKSVTKELKLLYYNILIYRNTLYPHAYLHMEPLYPSAEKIFKDFRDDQLPLRFSLIPARNEEHNISQIVNSLLVQDYPSYELIV
jgi:cellulose synthase/poly-beta-1,6-N-acetylglucosamine synthase-like glycosyltransferase